MLVSFDYSFLCGWHVNAHYGSSFPNMMANGRAAVLTSVSCTLSRLRWERAAYVTVLKSIQQLSVTILIDWNWQLGTFV